MSKAFFGLLLSGVAKITENEMRRLKKRQSRRQDEQQTDNFDDDGDNN